MVRDEPGNSTLLLLWHRMRSSISTNSAEVNVDFFTMRREDFLAFLFSYRQKTPPRGTGKRIDPLGLGIQDVEFIPG